MLHINGIIFKYYITTIKIRWKTPEIVKSKNGHMDHLNDCQIYCNLIYKSNDTIMSCGKYSNWFSLFTIYVLCFKTILLKVVVITIIVFNKKSLFHNTIIKLIPAAFLFNLASRRTIIFETNVTVHPNCLSTLALLLQSTTKDY